MKIYKISKNNLETIKSNLRKYDDFLKYFADNDFTKLEEWFLHCGTNLFEDTKMEVADFKLKTNSQKPYELDFDNAKELFENLKFLSRSQASEEGLWAALCMKNFWSYTKKRWDIENKFNEKTIINHCFFGKKGIFRNSLARLWWSVKMTYDESFEDPYMLTKIFWSSPETFSMIFDRSFSRNNNILKAFFLAILEAQKEVEVSRSTLRKIAIQISLLGSIYILDAIEPKKLQEKIYKKIIKISKEKNNNIKTEF